MTILSSISAAMDDFTGGLSRYPLWHYLAHREVKLRYARSFLGPVWITLTMALWVTGLSLLYGGLFGASLGEVAPFITLGVIGWNFITTVMQEGCVSFVSARGYLLQSKMPLTTFTWLVFYRNVIILSHNMLVFFALVFIFQLWPNMNWLWILAGWPLVFLSGFSLCLLLAVLAARYRDITPLVSSVMTVGFFLTPVMWRPSDLTKNRFIADLNPFAQLLEVFRSPLLGERPSDYALIFAACTTLALLVAAFMALATSKKRILYWL